MKLEYEKQDTIGFGFLYDNYCPIYRLRVLKIHIWKWDISLKW